VRRWVAVATPQFWLIWVVLFLNVSAGIGVIGMASPMLQEIFGGALIGHPDIGFTELDDSQKKAIAAIAAGFAGLISLFNIAGRFFWASMSDRIGRKNTYFTFFLLGIACYSLSPWAAHAGSKALFVALVCIILSMYGGGFATVPAYLADMFGTLYVGAIRRLDRRSAGWSSRIAPMELRSLPLRGARPTNLRPRSRTGSRLRGRDRRGDRGPRLPEANRTRKLLQDDGWQGTAHCHAACSDQAGQPELG
jgi:hypothetical protein